jgi:hypothetical protein
MRAELPETLVASTRAVFDPPGSRPFREMSPVFAKSRAIIRVPLTHYAVMLAGQEIEALK